MAFVVSEGQISGIEKPATPRFAHVDIAADFSPSPATVWRTQPQVRTVVSFLARNIAQIGLHSFERVSDTQRRRLTDHPLPKLINKPNMRTSRYRMIEALVSDLGIYDVGCWLKVTPKTGGFGLIRLLPDQISPGGDSWFGADHILLKGNRGKIEIPIERVVLFHGYDPTDSRWGVSPMETLRRVLAEEYHAGLWRERLWRNGARFPGYIKRPPNAKWNDAQRSRFREDWRGLYTGDGPGVGGTPVLEDGMEFHASGITPEQAQYMEARKLTREEVAAAYHIPLPMVGILDHATFSNIAEQHKQLYQDTLGPWLTMIQEEIALQLVPEFDDSGKVYVEFNLAEKLKGSFEEQAQQLQTSVGAPWLTRNEARARQNLPPVDGGDTLIVPLNVIEGGQASPTDSGSQNVGKSLRLAKTRAPKPFEDKAAQVVAKFLTRQEQVIRSALGAKSSDDWWDGSRWNSELSADLYRVAALVSREVGRKTAEQIGFDPDQFDEERTFAWLNETATRSAKSINSATKAAIAAALTEDDVDEALTRVFDTQEARATATAVSTVTLVSSFATVEAAQQLAAGKAEKTWQAGRNPRPEHAAMDGETVSLDSDFSNGLAWPGDSSSGADDVAGCNCELVITIP